MIIKTKDYLAKVRNKTGFTDYKIAKKYDINLVFLRPLWPPTWKISSIRNSCLVICRNFEH